MHHWHDKRKRERGDIGIYVSVMLVLLSFILLEALQLSLAAYALAGGWDVRKQRDFEARSCAIAVKEAILAVAETATTTSGNTLVAELNSRLTGITNGTTGISLTSNAANNSIAIPSTPQWPTGTPLTVSTATFSNAAYLGIGRNAQALLGAGPVAALAGNPLSFTFTETNGSYAGETTTYQVNANCYSIPISNFNWIPYGLPTQAGVGTTSPTAPSFSKAASGLGFTTVLANGYSGEAGTFPEHFGGMGTGLPGYYRDLTSLTWNLFEYWTSLSYQNALYTAAGASNIFDYSNTGNLPNGVTWDGTRAYINLGTTTASVVVFVDSLGGNILRLTGAGATGNPVVVVIRNFSSTPTTVEISGGNARSTVVYAPNSTITPLSAGLSFRGAFLLFPNSTASGTSLNVNGLVAYPQTFAAPPNMVAYVDAQAQSDLAPVAPRFLLISTRGFVP